MSLVPGIVAAAVAALPSVVTVPEGPGCDLKAFGESAVEISVEFWVSGVDGGKNRYMSPVMFAVWNALKEAEIEMPYPQPVVHMKAVAGA